MSHIGEKMEEASTTPDQDKAARIRLAEIGGELTPDEIAELPIAVVYNLLHQFGEGAWPPTPGMPR
ncbi:hypothetical protein CWO89_29475 [Bradyrhizobium sp. Leo170]|nr:hypothetical protein CWO90_31445 [Bradyrhizobium sp. Leo121]TAI62480.1 hypothetical protein CWO89_29475 [Bradyrhizobium sp. Leo170]